MAAKNRPGAVVLDLLVRLAREQGKTLIMVTHSPDIATLADRVLNLDHGRLIETKSKDVLQPNSAQTHVEMS